MWQAGRVTGVRQAGMVRRYEEDDRGVKVWEYGMLTGWHGCEMLTVV